MSGGHFDYYQHQISEIADSIEKTLNRQGKPKPKEELYMRKEYYDEYPEDKVYETYPDIVQEKMREAITHLRKAYIYAQRVDWFLSGDDGIESFISRLNQELSEL